MIEATPRFDMPAPGAVGWLDVSADNPDTWVGRWRTGPLGMQIAPMRHSRAPFGFHGARLRGTRCIWSASTISGAVLSRGPRTPGPAGFENGIHLLARVTASGSVFEGSGEGAGVLRVYDPPDEIVEQFDGNTHLYTLNIPRAALGIDPSTVLQMRGTTYELTTFQRQVLRSALGLLEAKEDDLSSGSSLVGLDRYLAALAGLLLRTAVRRPPKEQAQSENLRVRADAIIYEQSADPELTPAVIAAQLNVSLRHLYRAFNGIESPAARIRRRRLERAAEILSAHATPGSGQVERVALECGFASAEYFSRAFRREFGLSPRAYRAAHREPSGAS
jgi:AraC-like DNA-binding protein